MVMSPVSFRSAISKAIAEARNAPSEADTVSQQVNATSQPWTQIDLLTLTNNTGTGPLGRTDLLTEALDTLYDKPILGRQLLLMRDATTPHARFDVTLGTSRFKAMKPGDRIVYPFERLRIARSLSCGIEGQARFLVLHTPDVDYREGEVEGTPALRPIILDNRVGNTWLNFNPTDSTSPTFWFDALYASPTTNAFRASPTPEYCIDGFRRFQLLVDFDVAPAVPLLSATVVPWIGHSVHTVAALNADIRWYEMTNEVIALPAALGGTAASTRFRAFNFELPPFLPFAARSTPADRRIEAPAELVESHTFLTFEFVGRDPANGTARCLLLGLG